MTVPKHSAEPSPTLAKDGCVRLLAAEGAAPSRASPACPRLTGYLAAKLGYPPAREISSALQVLSSW